jgi:hypothetical protein
MLDYSRKWREYRRLRNLVLGVTVSAMLLMAIAVFLSPLGFDGLEWIVALSIAGAGVFSAAIVAALRVEAWRCPRCGRSFVSKWWSKLSVFFVTECANCGLKKFADGAS